jgi:competence protein ComEA
MAQRIGDGMKLYIPTKEDILDGVSTSHNITTGQMGSAVSINNASQQSIENLSGVGPATASKIIEGRPYMSLDELVTKKAVGAKLYEKIKSQLTL